MMFVGGYKKKEQMQGSAEDEVSSTRKTCVKKMLGSSVTREKNDRERREAMKRGGTYEKVPTTGTTAGLGAR